MTDVSQQVRISTIGHSNQSFAEFAALLKRHRIATVVDVRSAPYSQWTPHFNRQELERSLAALGIGYAFAGDHLGGRPSDPTCYRSGTLPEADANYLDLVDYAEVTRRPWYQRGLDRLIAIASERPTAIMCSEEEPNRCHRHHLIAQSLLGRGIDVVHLRRNGASEPAVIEPKQLSLLP